MRITVVVVVVLRSTTTTTQHPSAVPAAVRLVAGARSSSSTPPDVVPIGHRRREFRRSKKRASLFCRQPAGSRWEPPSLPRCGGGRRLHARCFPPPPTVPTRRRGATRTHFFAPAPGFLFHPEARTVMMMPTIAVTALRCEKEDGAVVLQHRRRPHRRRIWRSSPRHRSLGLAVS
jgi:hypothetical protein